MGCPLLSLQTIPVSSEFSQRYWSQASTDRLTSLAHGARYMEQIPETSEDIHKNSCQPFSEKNPPRPCDPWVIHPCAFFMVAAYQEAAPKLSKCDLNSPLLGVWPWIWLHQKRLWSEKANSVQPAGLSCPYFFFFLTFMSSTNFISSDFICSSERQKIMEGLEPGNPWRVLAECTSFARWFLVCNYYMRFIGEPVLSHLICSTFSLYTANL